MKVLLTENVTKLGKAGDVVEVSTGYARNYLIPRKLGVEATKQVLAQWGVQKKSAQIKADKLEQEARAQAAELSKKSITVVEKAGEQGRLFGAVTSQDVADAIKEQLGLDLDKKKISVPDDIKQAGEYKVLVKLTAAAQAEIKMTVKTDA